MADVPTVVVVLLVAAGLSFVICPALAFCVMWRWGRPPRSASRAYLAAMLGFVVGLGIAVVGIVLAIKIPVAAALHRGAANLD